MKNNNILFRSSGVGNLMTDARGTFTNTDQKKINELYAKAEKKALTAIQQKTLDDLTKKKEKPFELSETAKKFVLETWLKNEYNYQEPLNTFPIQKGKMCEQDILAMATKYIPGGYRKSNAKRKSNDCFTGLIDTGVFIKSEKVIEDMKSSYTVKTFMEAKLSKLYYSQIQSYMDLWDAEKGRLVYGLVNTPPAIFEKLETRLMRSFDGDVENPDFQEQHEQLRIMHHPEEYIPESKRIKYFEFERNQEWIDEMRKRCLYAREYYNTLELGMIDTSEVEKFVVNTQAVEVLAA